jgi:HAD superfamily hydrolase (TIGR01450 family)
MAEPSIWEGIDVLVCDLDGVVYLGDEGLAGSGEALASIAARGVGLVFVTNNSTKTPQQVAEKIRATTGYPADARSVVTSAEVTASRLAGKVATAFVVGGSAINDALAAVGIAVTDDWALAEAVVVGLDRDLTYDRLAAATLALRNGAEFYATNTDATYPTPQGQLPGGGVMVAALEVSSGVAPIVSGKPEPAMRDYIAARTVGTVLAVGDRPETDIAMARASGWASALVLTGATESLEDVPAEFIPDLVVATLADLARMLPAAEGPPGG